MLGDNSGHSQTQVAGLEIENGILRLHLVASCTWALLESKLHYLFGSQSLAHFFVIGESLQTEFSPALYNVQTVAYVTSGLKRELFAYP